MSFTIAISKSRVPYQKNIWLISLTVLFVLSWLNSIIGTYRYVELVIGKHIVIHFCILSYWNISISPVSVT
jgi:hypothetical protein